MLAIPFNLEKVFSTSITSLDLDWAVFPSYEIANLIKRFPLIEEVPNLKRFFLKKSPELIELCLKWKNLKRLKLNLAVSNNEIFTNFHLFKNLEKIEIFMKNLAVKEFFKIGFPKLKHAVFKGDGCNDAANFLVSMRCKTW